MTGGTEFDNTLGSELLGSFLNVNFTVAVSASWCFCDTLCVCFSVNGFIVFTVFVRVTINALCPPMFYGFGIQAGQI